MKSIRISYTNIAHQFIKKIHPSIKSGLREAIEELSDNPLKGKPLQEEFSGFRSHRFKKYRIIYRYQDSKKSVEIIFAGPRSNVYHLFSDYLKKARNFAPR